MPLIGRAGDTCGVRIPGPEYPLVPGRLRAPAARNFIAPVKKALRMYTLKLPGGIAARRLSLASAILMAGPVLSQSVPDDLQALVVVATRTPADIRTLGTAVDLMTAEDLSRRQVDTLAAALWAFPGVPSFANGAAGSDVSVFTRGSNSGQTLFLVDGIRLNDANTDYAVFLGGARLGASDTIEVARGPQSTLYGSGAVGGVVSIQAQRGSGEPTASVSLGAGSFGSASASVDALGARGGWAWSLSADASRTENDRPNNAFESEGVVLRVDRDLSPSASAGATLRGFEGRFGDPGDVYTNDAYAHESESNWLGTVFADLRPNADLEAHVIAGGQARRYVSFDEVPGVFSESTVIQNRRGVLDLQATYRGVPGQRMTAGASAEAETTQDDGYGGIDRRQTYLAAFAEDEWHPAEQVYLTGGVRYDDFDTFGSAVTGRATAAWLTRDRSLKVRASYGTGFNSPSFLELYGAATGYVGNPGLRPESSRGGDAGVDLYLPEGAGSLSATVFRTDTRNLIVYDFSSYPGTTANVGRARMGGVELEAKLALSRGTQFHASYTYLSADDLTDGTRLLRRPRNSGSADLWQDLGGGWSAGAGIQVVAGRLDVDALTFSTVSDPDYAVARVFAEWRAGRRLTLKARVENLFNKRYQPVNGYPALGMGAFGEVDWRL